MNPARSLMSSSSQNRLTADILKSREQQEAGDYPDNLALRVHGAVSWIQRAEMPEGDPDIAFTCYWIAFNAAYAEDTASYAETPERDIFRTYFDKLLRLDGEGAVYNAIWDRFSGPVRILLANKYVYQPFWKHVNGVDGYGDWEARFHRDTEVVNRALAGQQTSLILALLFDRLYVLRNQILHGGATWNGSVNRSQVRDGAAIMGFLVPSFVKVMMDYPDEPWGANYYPVVG